MLIETKFEVGQKVFIILSGNIQQKVIVSIKISIASMLHITYEVSGFDRAESEIFKTKEEAIIGWLSKQDVDMLIIKGKL